MWVFYKYNHLPMKLQKQHFLLSCFKTPSVGPAGAWTRELPHGSRVSHQLRHRRSQCFEFMFLIGAILLSNQWRFYVPCDRQLQRAPLQSRE